jgi:lipid A 3-O-deacylase
MNSMDCRLNKFAIDQLGVSCAFMARNTMLRAVYQWCCYLRSELKHKFINLLGTCLTTGGILLCLTLVATVRPAYSASGLYDFATQYPGFGTSSTTAVPVTSNSTTPMLPMVNLKSEAEPKLAALPENENTSVISEYRFGLLAHNVGPLAGKTEDGVDVNMEILFNSPDFMDNWGNARPFIGTSINVGDDTSFLYSGFMWDFDLSENFFTSLSFGMSIHNGNDGEQTDSDGKRALGCWWLFRESVELGYKLTDDVAIAGFLDHVSHGGICSNRNRGMDATGVRLHYSY